MVSVVKWDIKISYSSRRKLDSSVSQVMRTYIVSTDVRFVRKQWALCTALQIFNGSKASYENAPHNHSLKHALPETFSRHTQPLAFLLHTQILRDMHILHFAHVFSLLTCDSCACLTAGQNIFYPFRGYIAARKDESNVEPLKKAATCVATEGYSGLKRLGK